MLKRISSLMNRCLLVNYVFCVWKKDTTGDAVLVILGVAFYTVLNSNPQLILFYFMIPVITIRRLIEILLCVNSCVHVW